MYYLCSMFGRYRLIICLILYGAGLFACPLCTVREAQQTVRMADSVWAAGQMYNDSVPLAQAFHTLHTWRAVYPDEYVHSCYHYGRLLREQDDPVSAMQTFISATHSRSRDYRILGRVYSNMGDIAHLAGEFELSYDMFARSANLFLQSGDTLLYYYALNRMAYELAEQGRLDETIRIIHEIPADEDELDALTCLTLAELYKKTDQYDSAVVYARRASRNNMTKTDAILILAQTYFYADQKDSAVYYANSVLSQSALLSATNNALYILANDPKIKDVETIRQAAAERSDTQKLIAIRHGKLTQAVQLLEQDINFKPSWTWLYAIIATILFTGIVIYVYVHKKHKDHQLLSQKIDALKNEDAANYAHRREQIEENCALFANSSTLKTDLNWNDFEMLCKSIDTYFYMLAAKLKQKDILNEQEIRLCILVLLNISRNQIADILRYAPNGVGKFKYRVAKKLHVEGKNLRKWLICLAIDEPYC